MTPFTPTGGDDTAALQAAISGATSLEILAGDAKITAPIVIDHECEIVWRKGARLLADHSSCDILSAQADWVRLIEPRIEAAVPRTGGSFIRAKAGLAHRFRSEGGRLTGYHTGLTIESISTAMIDSLSCLGGVAGQGAAVEVLGGTDLSIADLLCDAPADGRPAAGVLLRACLDLILARASIMNHGFDLFVQPRAGEVAASFWVIDSFLDSAIWGAVFATAGGSIVRNKMRNVWCGNHTQGGALVQGAVNGLDIEDLNAFLNALNGLLIDAGAKNVNGRGGKFAANGGNGIAVAASVTDFSVMGARCGNSDGLAGNTSYGMLVSGTGHARYRIMGNDFTGNTVGALSDPVACPTKIVKDNLL